MERASSTQLRVTEVGERQRTWYLHLARLAVDGRHPGVHGTVDFVHVGRGVEARGAVVLRGYDLGRHVGRGRGAEWLSAPVVGNSYLCDLLRAKGQKDKDVQA